MPTDLTQNSSDSPIPDIRLRPETQTLLDNLDLLQHLPGTWIGTGFNLIARPQFAPISGQNSDFFLELNLTQEILKFDLIRSAIPNRGLAQDDINLFGLHYLQQISDAITFGASTSSLAYGSTYPRRISLTCRPRSPVWPAFHTVPLWSHKAKRSRLRFRDNQSLHRRIPPHS